MREAAMGPRCRMSSNGTGTPRLTALLGDRCLRTRMPFEDGQDALVMSNNVGGSHRQFPGRNNDFRIFRGYVELASGLSDLTRARAMEAAQGLRPSPHRAWQPAPRWRSRRVPWPMSCWPRPAAIGRTSRRSFVAKVEVAVTRTGPGARAAAGGGAGGGCRNSRRGCQTSLSDSEERCCRWPVRKAAPAKRPLREEGQPGRLTKAADRRAPAEWKGCRAKAPVAKSHRRRRPLCRASCGQGRLAREPFSKARLTSAHGQSGGRV